MVHKRGRVAFYDGVHAAKDPLGSVFLFTVLVFLLEQSFHNALARVRF